MQGVLIQDVPLWHPALVPLPSEMVSSAAESIASAGLASLEPNLATSAPEGGWLDLKVPSGSLKGSSSAQVMQPPPALAYFMAGDGPKKLVASALKRLDTACCMIGDGRGGLAGLALSGDIDFGVQRVVVPSGEDLTLVARAVAQSPGGLLDAMLLMGALPSMHARANGTARMNAHAHAHAGNGVLGSNGDTAGEPGSGSASANGALSAVERGGVLKLAPLAVRNTSRDTTFWVLGGVAAPNLPHTFAALDDARIFWAEGEWLRAIRATINAGNLAVKIFLA